MTVTRYVIELKAVEPLLLGQEQTVGNYRASGEVISGRTLRGAVAAVIRRDDSDLFHTLFDGAAQEQVRFGPFFPAESMEDAAPLPPTTFSCKYYPGRDGHGVFDALIRQYAYEVVTAAKQPALPDFIDEPTCPICGETTEPYQRFEAEPKHISTTHVAINRTRRVAEDAQLYMREGVGLGSTYIGQVYVPEALDNAFQKALSLVQQSLRVGANRSRGMGLVHVTGIEDFQPEDEQAALDTRIRRFNRSLSELLQYYSTVTGLLYEESIAAQEDRYFTIDLRSEAILLEHGIPTSIPSLPIPALLKRRWIEWQPVGGWHAAAGLPRRTQPAVSGTYLYCWEDTPRTEQLLQLEVDGIGEMREQGFGQLSICNPIHLNLGWREEHDGSE